MSAKSFLDQILGAVGGAVGGAAPGAPAGGGPSHLGKYATGAAAGGALALLLGTKRGRGMGGSVVKYGSVAALGALAYRAYSEWQRNQQAQAAAQARPAPPVWNPGAAPAAPAWHTPAAAVPSALPAGGFDRLPAPVQDEHSRAMLKALIAAAKSDGHLDPVERSRVDAELQRLEGLQSDPGLRHWVTAELQRPLDPAEVAAAAATPEMAAEMYLASLLMVDTQTPMERMYLDALAQALRLPPDLRATLDQRAAELA